MTMALVWTGVAFWLAQNAVVALRMYATQPGTTTLRPYRGPYRII